MIETTLFFLAVLATAPRAQHAGIDASALFHEHCASCHGETGDGDGWAELDRKARSFKEGGFSFGNTPETILRTITHGIPGTPMPSFDAALSEAQRMALAAHVISLGPPDMSSAPSNTEMVVIDRPLIARGHLPPIVPGAEARPRGLLIGTLEGLTFEYRTDDVRLLGVRSGAFCDRTDWVGRGGTGLKPLGKVVVLQDGGDPLPTFWEGSVGTGVALRGRLTGSRVANGKATVSYWLVHPDRGDLALVHEEIGACLTSIGAGHRRVFRIEGAREPLRLAVVVARGSTAAEDAPTEDPILGKRFVQPGHQDLPHGTWIGGIHEADGRFRWIRVDGPEPQHGGMKSERVSDRYDFERCVAIGSGETAELSIAEFMVVEPTQELLDVMRELPR